MLTSTSSPLTALRNTCLYYHCASCLFGLLFGLATICQSVISHLWSLHYSPIFKTPKCLAQRLKVWLQPHCELPRLHVLFHLSQLRNQSGEVNVVSTSRRCETIGGLLMGFPRVMNLRYCACHGALRRKSDSLTSNAEKNSTQVS